MTRKTYYLPTAVADSLDDAVHHLIAATGGRTAKHEALAAIINAGCQQAPALASGLRAVLLAELAKPEPGTESTNGKEK